MKKMKFKKISAILSGVLVAGLTIGTAAAASYPAPFVDDGVADVGIVYGTGAGVSSLDRTQAESIQDSLSGEVTGKTTVTGGESFTLEKSSVKFHYGDNLSTLYPTLDGDELPVLADGEYKDGDIKEDYSQKITLGDAALGLFSDRKYNDDEPSLGFALTTRGENVLEYEIEFDDPILFTDMADTEMPFLGNEYYVLSADSDSIELLDSSNKATLAYGETLTIGGKDVTVDFISDGGAKLTVDGESTAQLDNGEYEELDDGTYVVVTEVLSSSLESMTSTVEVAIGSGKMILHNGDEVELNEEDVDGLETTFVTSTDSETDDSLDSITLSWDATSDYLFLTEEDSITMPGFGSFSLIFGGLNYPSDSEVVSVNSGQQLTLNMDNYDLDLMFWDDEAGEANLGSEFNTLVLTENADPLDYAGAGYANDGAVWWMSDTLNDSEAFNDSVEIIGSDAEYLNLSEENRFLVTVLSDDASTVETLYYELTVFDTEDEDVDDFSIELEDLIGSRNMVFDEIGEYVEEYDVKVTLRGFNSDNNVAYLEFESLLDDTLTYNLAVSDKGLVVTIPEDLSSIEDDVDLMFTEADYRGDVNEGDSFNITVTNSSNDELHVSDIDSDLDTEEFSDDIYEGYVNSDLASKVTFDKSSDENDFEIEYFGKEATAEVMVTTGGESSTTDALGEVLYRDTEITEAGAMNLIIVGGSCINSAAATVLGGAYCGEDFTDATGVGEGQFLIKGFENSAINGKLALVVAGYNAEDTVNAATYLTNEDVDTSAEYIGTSSTQAELVVA